MKIRFSLHFRTVYGQVPCVFGSAPELGGGDPERAVPMVFHPDFTWTLECGIDWKQDQVLSYGYLIRNDDGSRLPECGAPRQVRLSPAFRQADFRDQWQGNTDEAPFLTKPFTEVFYPQPAPADNRPPVSTREIRIRATVPLVERDDEVRICGDTDLLGGWEPGQGAAMQPCGGCRWEIRLPAEHCPERFRYKFVLRRQAGGESVWETGEDRLFVRPDLPDGTLYTVEHAATGLPVGRPRFAGTAIPVFSLRSENGFGIGDFTDLKKMADWAVLTGQRVLQLLPVNDTTATGTWTDSYPYSGISVMALHPVYLNPDAVGPLEETPETIRLSRQRRLLNELPEIDYEAVLQLKEAYIRLLFRAYSADTFAREDFLGFYRKNKEWLLPYAAFCILRDKYGTADFSRWGSDAVYTPEIIDRLNAPDSPFRQALSLRLFVQYHLHRQLKDAVSYAHAKGVAVKGDIPIGITPHSVEAWTEPGFFHMDSQAGAPPDDFAAEGQNWGFPTYDWEAMARDRYGWWKRRFARMAEYFDLYRIDHILGFFRIWEIPRSETSGLMGHFSPALPLSAEEIRGYGFEDRLFPEDRLFLEDPRIPGRYHPRISARSTSAYRRLDPGLQKAYDCLWEDFFFRRHNRLWENEARRKLPELTASTGMMACAEDLGMIPDCVPHVLRDLRIASLEIQRMPKEPAQAFGIPARYPYLCVCSTGTHDMATLREWWEEDRGRTEAYCRDILGEWEPAPRTCEPRICERIVRDHLESPAMLVILPWQDWMATDGRLRRKDPREERINVPSDPAHYWRYRMHLSLEYLLRQEDFNNRLKQTVTNCILCRDR